ncbi:hypothetical protein SDC9_137565 [bioreactor metagenome]|uniref:Uncharacterized protein n=1 Tax=bioreactor metagenome TaxID=1076179 RepID=A0A645DLW7_9ZZZZ
MMLSSPRCAASRVRATGASANSTPMAASFSPTSRADATVVVLRSTITCGLRGPDVRPLPPRLTACTAGPPGSERNTMSASCASSARLATRRASVSFTASNAASLLSNASTTPGCLSAMLRHIGPPITPRPTKPITGVALLFAVMACLRNVDGSVHPHAAADVERRAGDPVRCGRAQEQRSLRNVLRRAITAERHGVVG